MRAVYSFILLMLSIAATAQTKVEIGKAVGEKYEINADTTVLRKSLQATLNDGTIITQMHIESVGQFHYLVGTGIYKNFPKVIAVSLEYDIMTRTYYATKGKGHITCASAACSDCKLFKENGQIIGCHCKEKSTISNQCNFTKKDLSLFYSTYNRMLKQERDKDARSKN